MQKRAIILGGGYSVREGIEQGLWNNIKDEFIIACNHCAFSTNVCAFSMDSIYTIPYSPQILVWLDEEFFTLNYKKIMESYLNGIQLYTCKSKTIKEYNDNLNNIINLFNIVTAKPYRNGLDIDKVFIGESRQSGICAISIALSLGFNEIYLLGFDFGTPSKDNKNTHYYGNIFLHRGNGKPELYYSNNKINANVKQFNLFNKFEDVKIYNVSLISNIIAFEKISYENFFKQIKEIK